MSAGTKWGVVVYDRRGRGLRRSFGPFRTVESAQRVADKINRAAQKLTAPSSLGDPQAIRAYVGYIHPGSDATVRNCVTDAPHPDTFKRPSES